MYNVHWTIPSSIRDVLFICVLALLLSVDARGGFGGGGRGGGGRGFSGGRSAARTSSSSISRGNSASRGTSTYRGAGGSSSNTPTINNNRITSGIYSGSSTRVGGTRTGGYTGGYSGGGYMPYGSMFAAGFLTSSILHRPYAPLVVDNMVYYWGEEHLPGGNASFYDVPMNDTSNILSSDANSTDPCFVIESSDGNNVTTCVNRAQTRCGRALSELNDARTSNLTFPDGSKPQTLNWLCPMGEVCCEWECCDGEKNESNITNVVCWVVIAGALILGLFFVWKKQKENRRIVQAEAAALRRLNMAMQQSYLNSTQRHSQDVISPPVVDSLPKTKPPSISNNEPPPAYSERTYTYAVK